MSDRGSRVSVVIPVYNSASTLARAAQSALRQTLSDMELIIVDDGSRDGSLGEARAIAAVDSRVRVIALPTNRGKPHAMNRAIAEANGVWIAVLDADDWYEPDRLAMLVAAAEANEVPLIADNQYFWDGGAGVMVGTAFPSEQNGTLLTKQAFIAGSNPYARFDYGMLKPMVRIDCIRRHGLAYHEDARLSEDFLYLLDFFAAGETGFLIARPMYNWTQSFGAISRQWTSTGAGDWRYDYDSAIKAYAVTLAVLRARHDDPLARLLAARMRAFKKLHHFSTLNRMRRSGAGIPRVAIEAAFHPSIWPMLLSRLIRT
jgi:glycosyltransferase involved in cell wall biosynthesis